MRDSTRQELRKLRERIQDLARELVKTRSSIVVMSLRERVEKIHDLLEDAMKVIQGLTPEVREALPEDIGELEDAMEKAEEARSRFEKTLMRLS